MKAIELAEKLLQNPNMDIKTTVHVLVPEEELAARGYKYPWNNYEVTLEIDDISYSDNALLLGCHIEN